MRVFVQLNYSNAVTVPVKKDQTVADILVESFARLVVTDSKLSVEEYSAHLAFNGALLVASDVATDVLSDGEHIKLVNKSVATGVLPLSSTNFPMIADSKLKDVRTLEGITEVSLDGESLTTELLVRIGQGNVRVKVTDTAWEKIKKARRVVDQVLEEKRTVYGINTGFGKFAKTMIDPDKLKELQENLIRSHASGVGQPLPPKLARMLLALRINTLAKGYSGIRSETVEVMLQALNANCLPWVPEKGTVGASGDLAPLAHQALGLMGEGPMWSPRTGWSEAKLVLEAHDIKPIQLHGKEGLGLINGTQFICSFGSEALERAKTVARQADVIAALTLEVLNGTVRAYDPDIHAAKPHKGQNLVAARLRSVLHSHLYQSEIAISHWNCSRVQDAYSLRCVPQVHGIVNDTIQFVNGIINTEMNSAADNPLVLADRNELISGGNFHGEYPAKALDYLAIGVHELANISERRLERLVHPDYSELPAFLVQDGGLNSGFMIAHCTAAALVSENKVLTHPSSVDSITTSAGQEDHVSMGGFSARKALQVVQHVETVLAIELLAACQALDMRRPLKTTEPLEAVYRLVRSVVEPLAKDRFMTPDIEAVTKLLQEGKVWKAVESFTNKYQDAAENKDKIHHY